MASAALLCAATTGAHAAPTDDDPTTTSTTPAPDPTPTPTPPPVPEPVPSSPGTGDPTTDPGATPSGGPHPVRVLIEGDSITQGFHGDYTWRYRLSREITRQRAPVDLVGSKHATYVGVGYTTSAYADPAFDPDHFATGGSRLYQHAAWIGDEAAVQRPDVVVLAAGVNDLRWGRTPQQAADSLRAWVTNLRSVVPDVRIVLSPVLAADDPAHPGLSTQVAAFDALEQQTALELTTEASPIAVADTTRGWSAATQTWDGVHPTPSGEALIAQRVAESLHTIGVLPHSPAIAVSQPWVRNLPVTVRLGRGSATLQWNRQMLTSVRVLMTAPGQRERLLPGSYTAGTATVPLLDGGRYGFRLVAVRRSMTSTSGPSTGATLAWTMATPPTAVNRVRLSATGVTWSVSPRARSYVVATLRAHGRWVTRTTTARALAGVGLTNARVWAVNPAGRSAATLARPAPAPVPVRGPHHPAALGSPLVTGR